MGVHACCPLTTLCQIAAGLFWRARVVCGVEPPTPRGTWGATPRRHSRCTRATAWGCPRKPLHTLPPARFYAAPRPQPMHAPPRAAMRLTICIRIAVPAATAHRYARAALWRSLRSRRIYALRGSGRVALSTGHLHSPARYCICAGSRGCLGG